MTSKECLERLLKIAYIEPGLTKEKFITYAREIEHNKKCSDLYNIISQDLDKLEKLEKAIEILKDRLGLFTSCYGGYNYKKITYEVGVNFDIEEITKDQYELLKEVL